jgi:hypothetical protein
VDLILHLGAHRCATASFQAYLAGAAPRLRAQGTLAWTPARTRGGLFDPLFEAGSKPSARQLAAHYRVRQTLAMHLSAGARAGAARLVISEPNLLGGPGALARRGRLYGDAAERLQRLAQALPCQPRRIGLSVRGYRGFWTSLLLRALRGGMPPPDRDRLDRLVTQPRRWSGLVLDIAHAFPRSEIVVWSFERFAGAPGTVLQALCGPEAPPAPPPPPGGIWRARSPLLPLLRTELGSAGLRPDALPRGAGRWAPFDAAQAEALHSAYLEDLRWLRRPSARGIRSLETPAPGAPAASPRRPGRTTRGDRHDRPEPEGKMG